MDGKGKVKPAVLAARQRGVLFDMGHGKGSFSWKTARAMIAEGFMPDTISSDVHALCINGPAYDQVTTLSKFLALGLNLRDVLRVHQQRRGRTGAPRSWNAETRFDRRRQRPVSRWRRVRPGGRDGRGCDDTRAVVRQGRRDRRPMVASQGRRGIDQAWTRWRISSMDNDRGPERMPAINPATGGQIAWLPKSDRAITGLAIAAAKAARAALGGPFGLAASRNLRRHRGLDRRKSDEDRAHPQPRARKTADAGNRRSREGG